MASATKFEALIFDGKGNFTMQQCTIKDLLVQQGLDALLEEEKPAKMKYSEWKSIQRKATSTIRLALTPAIKYIVLNETTPMEMWEKVGGDLCVEVINQPFELEDRLVHIENGRRR